MSVLRLSTKATEKAADMRKGLLALAVLFLSGCDARPDYWTAWVYPNKNNLAVSQMTPGFASFELCQRAAIDQLRRLPDPDGGDYECGHKCQQLDGMSGYQCATIRK